MNRVTEKVLSGRWLLTMSVSAGWLYMVVTGGVDKGDVSNVLLLVATWYFNKVDRKDNHETQQ